jgi:hypothetical protein
MEGQMARYAGGGKNTVEACQSIDVLEWRRKGYIQPPVPGSLPYSMTAKCGDREQRIATVWAPCRFGGKRAWFQCEYCGRWVVRLYVVGRVLACRHCHRLGYDSQLETPHQRGSGRAQKIQGGWAAALMTRSGSFPPGRKACTGGPTSVGFASMT